MTRRAVVRSARRVMRGDDGGGWNAWSLGGLVLVIALIVGIVKALLP
jgi:hypothetical protein